MNTKKRLQRFLSIFLACIMVCSTPLSVLASDEIFVSDTFAEEMIIDAAEEENALSEETELPEDEIIPSEDIFFEDEAVPEDEIVMDEMVFDESEITEDPEVQTGEVTEEIVDEIAGTPMENLDFFGDGTETEMAEFSAGEAVDENKTDFNISEGNVEITKDGVYTVTGSTTSSNITVADGVTATITLDNVTITHSNGSCNGDAVNTNSFGTAAIALGEGSNVTLKLVGNNALTSGAGRAGIEVPGKIVHKNGTKTESTPANLTIEGDGNLTVNASTGAAIGAGYLMNAGNITINSGNITAQSSSDSAAIGGAHAGDKVGQVYGSFGTITINGGIVNATGANTAAAIGNGCHGNNASGTVININGGIVTANGGSYQGQPDDIGMAYKTGAAVTPTVNISGNAIVIADRINKKMNGPVNHTGGIIVSGSTATMSGSMELGQDYTLPTGTVLTIPSGETLVIPFGKTLTVNGTITGEGSVMPKGGVIVNEENISCTLVKGEYFLDLSVDPASQVYNQKITLTAHVKKTADDSVAADMTGTVSFTCGETELGTAELKEGTAALITAVKFAAGTYKIQAAWTYNDSVNTDIIAVTVTKAEQAKAPSTPAKAAAVASTSVELEAVTDAGEGIVEYGYAEKTEEGEVIPKNWQTETIIKNLVPGKTYLFYSRFAGNEYYNPIVSETGLEVTTTALPAMSAPVLSAEPVSNKLFAITLTAPATCKELEEATVQYSMSSDNGETWGDWQDSAAFSGLTEDQEYQFRARYAMTQYEHYSEAGNVITLKAKGIVIPEENYDIFIGDTATGNIYEMRVGNINISGVKVLKHTYDSKKAVATLLLDSKTDKTSPIQFVFDCVKSINEGGAGGNNIDRAYISIKGSKVGAMYPNGDGLSEGKHVLTMTPVESTASYTQCFVWDENNEAQFTFTAYGGFSNQTKDYTVRLCIASEENTAPVVKKGLSDEVSADITLGEGYSVVLKEIFEDKEMEEMTYTVSVNDGEPEAVSGEFYSFGPEEPGEYTLVFKAKDNAGLESKPYTVKVTAMRITTVEIGGTAVDAWNSDIKKVEIGVADITSVTKAEKEANTWYVTLNSAAKKEDSLFLRVFGSARAGRWQGVNVNGKGVEGAESDGTNFIWSAYYTPEWNDLGEATLVLNALPQNNNRYVYTLKLKIPSAENKAPEFADGNSKTEDLVQYSAYTADVASMFKDADDTWLTYYAAVNDGEYAICDKEYSYTPLTTGEHKLSFKAKDLAGAESEAYVVTLNVSGYQTPEGACDIQDAKNGGILLNMTILDNNGEKIPGVSFEKDDSVEGTRTITVTLPGTMKTNDTVKASFHIVQNETGEPFLSTRANKNAASYKTDLVSTTLKQGKGETTLYWFGQAPTSNNDVVYDTYVIKYQIVREDNKAPVLAENTENPAEVTIDQYNTWSLDLSTVFTDAEDDELTYTVRVNGEETTIGKDYTYKAETDEDPVLLFRATDPFGGKSSYYTVILNVNFVHRCSIATDDGGHSTFGGTVKTILIDGQKIEKYVYKKIDETNRVIVAQLDESVPDDAQLTISWEDSGRGSQGNGAALSVTNPVQLVDGKAVAILTTTGNFFFGTKYSYQITITKEKNTLPTLAENVGTEETTEIIVGNTYEIDLSKIFTDADGDALTYSVAVNDGEAAAAEAEYRYTPAEKGTYKLVFKASDLWGDSESYTVHLTVKANEVTYDAVVKVPDAVTPEFYINTGFTAEGEDIIGELLNVEKGQSENGWTSYTVKVPENLERISFRGMESVAVVENSDLNENETTSGTVNWGGMSIAVEKDMEPVVLRQVQAVINTKIDDADGKKVGLTEEQAVFKVKYEGEYYAPSGDTGVEENGYLYYRFLLVAADNSLVYTYYAEPLGDLINSFNTNQGDVKTVTTDTAETLVTVLPLALRKPCKITVPADAEVEMFNQSGYYNVSEVIPHETIDNGDGTKTVVFNDRGMFRVSKEGEITKAGYSVGEELVVNWEGDDRGPDYRRDYATDNNWMATRGDDSMYVNVNYRNNLQIAVDEEFQLRAYRIWEIINTDTNNIMIEPDFHYNIISGADVISVTTPEECSGNAKNNWLDIKGLKAGTAVLEVSYDAIDIISGGGGDFGNPEFTYNACDPARTALIVVQVGSPKNDIDFAIDANRTAGWDVEFDTLYFAGDSAELQFSPKSISGTNTIAKVEVSNDKGGSYTPLAADQNGVYTAKIVSGNNILRVTTSDGTQSYQLVRGDKISITLNEVEGFADRDGIIEAGEKIRVQFHGVHNVIGKMSGIYNPTGYQTNYTYNGDVISGSGGQYTYPSAAYVDVTLPGTTHNGDTVTLTNGNTTNGGWGSAGGAHRAVTGEVPPNLDAGGITNSGRNIFPDITITVGEKAGNVTPEKPHEHEFSSWKTTSKATVFKAAVQKRTCAVCGETETRTRGKKLTAVLEVPGKLKSFNIKVGNTRKFKVTMANGDSIKSVKSNKSGIVKSTFSKKNGTVTLKGVKAGTAKITITLKSGKKRTYTVKAVKGTVATTKLTVNNVTDKKLTLKKGKTFTIKTTRVPFTSTQKVTYKTSNNKIVKVNAAGKLTAVKKGTAYVTVKSGGKSVKIKVTVK